MNKEDVILSLLQEFKDDVNRRFDEQDKKFEQRFNYVDVQLSDMKDKIREVKEDMREIRLDIKEEKSRVDEIYHERKNMKISWSLPFIGFNAGVSACVAFFVSLWR